MSGYRIRGKIVPALPDGRLAIVELQLPDRPDALPLITTNYLEGHISPYLLQDLNEYIRHLAASAILTLDTSRIGQAGEWDCWYERLSPSLLPLRTFRVGLGRTDGRDFYAFRVRSDMMSKELAEELNQHTIPGFIGALPYRDGARDRIRRIPGGRWR